MRLTSLALIATTSEIVAWHACHKPKVNILHSKAMIVLSARCRTRTLPQESEHKSTEHRSCCVDTEAGADSNL